MSTATPPPADDRIRGLTNKQPWTTCILTGAKTIENRPKHWSWRGRELPHAGQSIDQYPLRPPLVARTIPGRSRGWEHPESLEKIDVDQSGCCTTHDVRGGG
ncbi:hypothetical protein ACWGLO_21805 [Streptomyces niveus]